MAVLISNKAVVVSDFEAKNSYVRMKINKYNIFCCYFSPNAELGKFLSFLEELQKNVLNDKNKIIILGDFNAKSVIWGSAKTDKRGNMLMEMLANMDFAVIMAGKGPRFKKMVVLLLLILCIHHMTLQKI